MKHFIYLFVLLCYAGIKVSAQQFDIYEADYSASYKLINDGKEVELTRVISYLIGGSLSIAIPEEVTYMNRKYKVTGIGERAFYYEQSITSISIPNGVTYIDKLAFSNCSSVSSVTIPNSVKSIGIYAFSGCASLKSITIPNSISTLEDGVFFSCGLTTVTIPDNITSIGQDAFSSCYWLSSISIPNSVTDIGQSAFSSCNSLKSITLPSSVKTIGEAAFYNCSLETIYSLNPEPPSLGYCTFFDGNALAFATLYVPKGTKEKYQSSIGWKFTYIEEIEPSSINTVKLNDEGNKYIYNLNGEQLKHTQRGVNIINGKKYILK